MIHHVILGISGVQGSYNLRSLTDTPASTGFHNTEYFKGTPVFFFFFRVRQESLGFFFTVLATPDTSGVT